MIAAEQTLNAALERLEAFDSELTNGLTNHAPMVVEALVALGRADAVDGWLDGYLPGARPIRPAQTAIDAAGWRRALGDGKLEPAWRLFFEQALVRDGWRTVLSRWLPRLAPGFAAAAAHGPIRAAHAARSLARQVDERRERELAGGLALWAASHQLLPADPEGERGTLTPAEALARVPLVPASRRRNSGSITAALTVLAHESGFPDAVAALDREAHWEALSLSVAKAFAGLFVDQVRSPLEAIVFTHALTGLAAARRLGILVTADTARSLVSHAWQTGCALYAVYGVAGRSAARVETATRDPVDAAIAHGDEHVIKLAEACVEFNALTGDGVFLAAAECCRVAIPSDRH
jgi:hypothetical protein